MERGGKGERVGGMEWLLDFMFQLYVDGRMYEYVPSFASPSSSFQQLDSAKRASRG